MKTSRCQDQGCFTPKTRHWGDGPWDAEPDRADFRHAGLACFVHRSRAEIGHWCGYVGVPRSHPAFGHDYDDLDVHVHGGLTFASKCQPGGHLRHPGKAKLWWLGFDCAHAGDYSPGMEAHLQQIPGILESRRGMNLPDKKRWDAPKHSLGLLGDHYWTIAEVIEETKDLAKQLSTLTHHHLRPSTAPERRRWKRIRSKAFLEDWRISQSRTKEWKDAYRNNRMIL